MRWLLPGFWHVSVSQSIIRIWRCFVHLFELLSDHLLDVGQQSSELSLNRLDSSVQCSTVTVYAVHGIAIDLSRVQDPPFRSNDSLYLKIVGSLNLGHFGKRENRNPDSFHRACQQRSTYYYIKCRRSCFQHAQCQASSFIVKFKTNNRNKDVIARTTLREE